MTNNFAPASAGEKIVFGARRPGYPSESVGEGEVQEWIKAMKEAGVQRVVCLLSEEQLRLYESIPGGLLGQYREAFGNENVLSAEVEDYHLINAGRLKAVVEYLRTSDTLSSKVVVHCSGGSGRTGHVLAAWLVRGRGHEVNDALLIASKTRNPREAVNCGNATEGELVTLLQGSTR